MILMHMRDGRTTSVPGPIAQKHVDGDGSAVRLAEIIGHKVPGQVSADAETRVADDQQIFRRQ
jgi:hypothetical protein